MRVSHRFISSTCYSFSQGLRRRLFSLSTHSAMPIQVGAKLPSVDLYENDPGNKVNTGEMFKSGKHVLFAVPGAFTPGCSMTHLPGFVENAEAIKAKGVTSINCISVNDPFTMAAWGKNQNVGEKVKMLADPCAAFTKAVDCELTNLEAILGNVRSKRYVMLVEDGVVKKIDVEPDGTGLTCSLAPEILKNL